MTYHIIFRSDEDEPLYTHDVAARLARISRDLLDLCEQEALVEARRMAAGTRGFSARDVRQLARIRRLHEDLGLDIAGVEVVLGMRQRMIMLLRELEEIEQRMARREEALFAQIRQLQQRMAEDVEWRL